VIRNLRIESVSRVSCQETRYAPINSLEVAMAAEDRCAALVRKFRREPDASARTLLVTIFGDSVAPRGGEVWLGTLSRLVEPLGISERLVRTSLQRLVTEGLVVNRREGRLSHYSIAPAARHEFWEADRRIYHPRTATPWDNRWTIAVESPGLAVPDRNALRQQLAWLGFGSHGASVHVCPLDRTAELKHLLADTGLTGQVVVFRGEVAAAGLADADLAQDLTGDLRALEPAWRTFLRRFGPLAEDLAGPRVAVDPEPAFLARTLLVHAYRRVVLREPELPAELWPSGWIGEQAYRVAATCYRGLAGPADAHLRAVCRSGGVGPTRVDPAYADRYAPTP
jgi:phenylacetic acid degradation operon negative regulatory protein